MVLLIAISWNGPVYDHDRRCTQPQGAGTDCQCSVTFYHQIIGFLLIICFAVFYGGSRFEQFRRVRYGTRSQVTTSTRLWHDFSMQGMSLLIIILTMLADAHSTATIYKRANTPPNNRFTRKPSERLTQLDKSQGDKWYVLITWYHYSQEVHCNVHSNSRVSSRVVILVCSACTSFIN